MPPIPPADAERIAALGKLKLLDSDNSASFDEIGRLVALTFDSTIAMISLLDEERHWIFAPGGTKARKMPGLTALCSHPITTGEPVLVRDALRDERFVDSPLAAGAQRIRSYLGHPIRSPEGHILGALSAADPSQEKFATHHVAAMEKLAALAEQIVAAHWLNLELERAYRDLASLRRGMERASRITRHMERIAGIGAWEFDVESSELIWSEGVYEIYGHPLGSPIDVATALEYFTADQRDVVSDIGRRIVECGEELDFQAEIIAADGRRKRVQVVGKPHGTEARRAVGVLKDITEHHEARLALQRAAEIDELTGLPNRNVFTASIEEAIRHQQDGGQAFHLLMFDLDGLKDTNDIYGHVVGDDALAQMGARLLALCAEKPFARWGGDEFMLLLRGGHSRCAVHGLAGQVLDAIVKPVEVQGKAIYLRATCGIAEYEAGTGARELVRRAHQALRYAKTEGPGRVQFYDRSFEQRNQARKAAELEVRSALEADRIFASYQPIVDLGSGTVEGYEALLRIATDDGRELTAAQLLPALIDPELSRMVAARMIALVASDCAAFAAIGAMPGFVSINATEADLLSGDYPEMLLAALARFDVPAAQITLEVTETMLLVNDLERVKCVLDRLKAAGVSIALDDFGTGFSSLTHLKVFPIDKVKIDRSFVADIVQDASAQSIVAAVIAMAQRLSIGVIAEGIENESQLAMLRQMDCTMGQGFLLSPPRRAACL